MDRVKVSKADVSASHSVTLIGIVMVGLKGRIVFDRLCGLNHGKRCSRNYTVDPSACFLCCIILVLLVPRWKGGCSIQIKASLPHKRYSKQVLRATS